MAERPKNIPRKKLKSVREKKAHKETGWSQAEVAAKMGVTPETYQRIENGKTLYPYPVNREALCRIFAMSAEELDLTDDYWMAYVKEEAEPSAEEAIPIKPKKRLSRRTILIGGVTGTGIIVLGIAGYTLYSATHQAQPSPSPFTAKLLSTHQEHLGGVRVLAWSPNNLRIATGSDDQTAHVWAWDAVRKDNSTVYTGHMDTSSSSTHPSFVEGVAWSPNGKRIASSGADATVQIWEPYTPNPHPLLIYREHSDWVNRIGWSSDGKYIVSGEQHSRDVIAEVRVWQAIDTKTVTIYSGHRNGVFSVAWSPDNKWIASCGYDGTIQVWNAFTGEEAFRLFLSNQLYGLSWSPGGKYVAVGGIGSLVWGVDTAKGETIFFYNANAAQVTDVAWSPNGKWIGCCTINPATVQIFDAITRKNLYSFPVQTGGTTALGWSHNGKYLAAGDVIGNVYVWHIVG